MHILTPCPICQATPKVQRVVIGLPTENWFVFCPCTETGLGTIGGSEQETAEKWNNLVELVISGAIDSETLEAIE